MAEQLAQVDAKLETLARTDERVQLLQTIPGVGRCTAEVIVAYLDDVQRFHSGKEVSAYAGLVPRQFQSGEMDRRGRITKRGPGLLRKVLVEASWLLLRYNTWASRLFGRLTRGQKTRRKPALVALARKLWCDAGRCCGMACRGASRCRWQRPFRISPLDLRCRRNTDRERFTRSVLEIRLRNSAAGARSLVDSAPRSQDRGRDCP
jgi:hypothetical protein